MGTCIIYGEMVWIDSGNAWKITPAEHGELGAERLYWIHTPCVENLKRDARRSTHAVR